MASRASRFVVFLFEPARKKGEAGRALNLFLTSIVAPVLLLGGVPWGALSPYGWWLAIPPYVLANFLVLWNAFLRYDTHKAAQKPVLAFYCGPSVKGSVDDPPITVPHSMLNQAGLDFIKSFRLKLAPARKENVKDCEGYLTGIRRDDQDLSPPNPVRLSFHSGSAEQPSAAMKAGTAALLNVIRISKVSNKITIPAWNNDWNFRPTSQIFSSHGTYKLTVNVRTPKQSQPVTLAFYWTGNANDSRLTIDKPA